MTDISDEMLSAYLDGELDAGTARRVDAALTTDPALAARIAALDAVNRRLRPAFSTHMQEGVPDRFDAILSEPPRAQSPFSRFFSPWLKPAVLLPAALCAAAGLMIGLQFGAPVESGAFQVRPDGRIVADAGLSFALSTARSGVKTEYDTDAVLVRVSFIDDSGAPCRHFALKDAEGLACKAGPEWQVLALDAVPDAMGPDGFAMAGATAAAGVEAAIARRGIGAALTPDDETLAIANEWKMPAP